MVAAAIALAFKAIYWGFLLTVTAVFIACFVRSVLEEEGHRKKAWLRHTNVSAIAREPSAK
jgi:hypothetical protein